MHLIIPIAGSSSRFPDMKPKWMLTHPRGKMMVIEAIRNLPLIQFKSINFIGLKTHEDEYNFSNSLNIQFKEIGIDHLANIILLDEKTSNQPETVYKGLKKSGITGQIYIKDSDNQFTTEFVSGNFISYLDLHELDQINARNKSYVELNDDGYILNIVEKKIVSPTFCVGGYGFEEADDFIRVYEQLSDNKDLYISHIIFQMLLEGEKFKGQNVSEYSDWGTIKEWNSYKAQYTTLFVDLDGTLVINSGQYSSPRWGDTDGIEKNITAINTLHASGKVEIILTTSRKESFREDTVEQLKRLGINYDQIIFGLVHGKRIVINDYAKTNPYKSCDAINIKRNSDDLSEMLEESLGFTIG
ncbi:MAG: hypothetical protein Q8L72_08330 [Moraxellaceae bacterium]|nr:hypothetical protein [Moraxellaceae bacterium]